ncbi:BglII/BstYI family type II restriction endonuclease [Peribacillus frigoritolerans]|uniref:BglII/BstYI family type II restriction endonuclease n=1 Tax=Peribacillus frigoritolerans TaxID=450367 RepID=UPI00380AA087
MTKKRNTSIQMNQQEADDWLSKTTGNLIITEENQYFFKHADLFLKNIEPTKSLLIETLQMPLYGLKTKVDTKVNTKGTWYARRLAADSLNAAIKHNLRVNMPEMKFEVLFNEGVFYDTPATSGFDFTIIDDVNNLINFRNYCFGRRAIYNGENMWREELEKDYRLEWKSLAELYDLESYTKGIDLPYNKTKPTIIGEIQFANWGLMYYDILKTIQIEQFFDIDFLIYITAAGNLSRYISDGTVNYEKTKKALDEFKNVIKYPIWLIGIDLE